VLDRLRLERKRSEAFGRADLIASTVEPAPISPFREGRKRVVGGVAMIVLMSAALRLFVSPRLEEQARSHAQEADTSHQHHMRGKRMSWRERLLSASAWSDVAFNFRGDWRLLWKEITAGFLLPGFIGLLGDDFFNGLFVEDAPPVIEAVENVIVGPLIAVLSFVCSVGNVPLAAVLWSGGISFAGVTAFIFAD
jgi:uncharacterized protein